jgi:hypothetical protein
MQKSLISCAKWPNMHLSPANLLQQMEVDQAMKLMSTRQNVKKHRHAEKAS